MLSKVHWSLKTHEGLHPFEPSLGSATITKKETADSITKYQNQSHLILLTLNFLKVGARRFMPHWFKYAFKENYQISSYHTSSTLVPLPLGGVSMM